VKAPSPLRPLSAPTFHSELLGDLEWRGLLANISDPADADRHFLEPGRLAYIGFDPTADSLHVGSLLGLVVLRRIQRAGHRPVLLIGGGTGLIGDPSGKSGERALNPEAEVAASAARLKVQVQRFLDFDRGPSGALLVNNYDWLRKMEVIGFLRDVGKHFPLGTMLAKESVRARMGRTDAGISFTEFSYQVLQAYDFLRLFQDRACRVQLGGSDQWGNITAGIDLIRRVAGEQAFGITHPLVTKDDGAKFGKTESGTIWLDAEKTSPYEMYQFWLNTPDADVVKFLGYFTFLGRDEVADLADAVATRPEAREAQRVLARDVTALVHGNESMREAEAIGAAMFGGDPASLGPAALEQVCRAIPTSDLAPAEVAAMTVLDLLVRVGAAESRGEARKLVAGGGITLNSKRVPDATEALSAVPALHGRFWIVRKGRRSYFAGRLGEASVA
jgi:tyrosyl-tRNA synthetase